MDDDVRVDRRQILPVVADAIPAFGGGLPADLREQMTRAVNAWMLRTPSQHTRRAYESDLEQFMTHAGFKPDAWDQLAHIRPEHVAAWRDALADQGQTNSSIRRKLTALRSLFSYLNKYDADRGYSANFEEKDGATRGECAMAGDFGADTRTARHAAKCAESGEFSGWCGQV